MADDSCSRGLAVLQVSADGASDGSFLNVLFSGRWKKTPPAGGEVKKKKKHSGGCREFEKIQPVAAKSFFEQLDLALRLDLFGQRRKCFRFLSPLPNLSLDPSTFGGMLFWRHFVVVVLQLKRVMTEDAQAKD